jgi:hypothetical protein
VQVWCDEVRQQGAVCLTGRLAAACPVLAHTWRVFCALHSTTMPAALSIRHQERLLRTAVRYSLATGRLVADGSCCEQALQGSVLCFKWTYVVVHLRGCCVFASSVWHTCLACLAQFKQRAP